VETAAFAELADRVAALMDTMSTRWHTEPWTGWPDAVRLVSDAGDEIALIPDGRSITARGFPPHPRDIGHGPSAPEITMAALSPAYVHGHIRRRLMPSYETARAQWDQLTTRVRAEQASRGAVAEQIAYALGAGRIDDDLHADVRVVPEQRRTDTTTVSRHRHGQHPVTVRADVGRDGEGVDLTVTDLTGDQAAEICALIHRLSP
jgi:hypothetical protein